MRQKQKKNNTFERRVFVFLVETKAQWDEGGGRTLLGDDIGSGAVMSRMIVFQFLDFKWTSYMYLHS